MKIVVGFSDSRLGAILVADIMKDRNSVFLIASISHPITILRNRRAPTFEVLLSSAAKEFSSDVCLLVLIRKCLQGMIA